MAAKTICNEMLKLQSLACCMENIFPVDETVFGCVLLSPCRIPVQSIGIPCKQAKAVRQDNKIYISH